jgi:DNA (cytosine-5)-methyltransferase 1
MALGKPLADEAMGIDWMNWRELTQSIPPAYTEFLGRHALAFLGKEGK